MIDYPEYIKVKNKTYKINTDFKVAIECSVIAENKMIGEFERTMAIIYLLFGEAALNDIEKDFNLLNDFYVMAEKYLLCGEKKRTKFIFI